MDHFEELQALRRELEQANYEYYVQDAPTMSDYDYDHKLRRLEELEGEHPELITPDSPTQRVGGKALESFQQVVHQVPLESLQDVFDYDELRQFDQRVRAAVPGAEYDVEPKVDGLSVALEYENGLFVRGATRGGRPGGGGCDGEPADRPVHPSAHPGRPRPAHRPGGRSICPKRCSTP